MLVFFISQRKTFLTRNSFFVFVLDGLGLIPGGLAVQTDGLPAWKRLSNEKNAAKLRLCKFEQFLAREQSQLGPWARLLTWSCCTKRNVICFG